MYGPAEVAKVIGVKRATLHSWLARGIIEVESQGAGIERQLTYEQVEYLAFLAAFTNAGIELSAAQEMLNRPRCQNYREFDLGAVTISMRFDIVRDALRGKLGIKDVARPTTFSWNVYSDVAL